MDVNFENATMSSFSSWGTTGDLRIKPEITAPGGSIYSVSGLTPDLLETGADRLWMVGGETALLDLLEQAGIQEGERRLVLIGTLTGESDMPRAQLN